MGDRTWTPATIADVDSLYELSIGEGTLDLTELRLGAGDSWTSPRGSASATWSSTCLTALRWTSTASVSGGDIVVLGQANSGLGVDLDRTLSGDGSSGTIALDLKVGFGQIEIIAMPGPAPRAELPTTTPTSVLG